jgi:hypothetical protein
LDDQSSSQLVTRQEKPPWFLANTIGKPRGAWPTFVSFLRAHTFQGDGLSLVYYHALGDIPKKLFDNIRDSNIFAIVDLRQSFNQIVFVTNSQKNNIPWKQQDVGMACDAF